MKKLIFGILACLNLQIVVAQANNFIEADNVNIQYVGRIDKTNPKAPKFAFPGVSITAKFSGTTIDAEINDQGYGGTQTTNYFNIFIDGVFQNVLQVKAAQTRYNLANSLSNTEHEIKLVKRTEASVGTSVFKGFYIEGNALLSPNTLPSKKIEFIGDSWTCGYGNEYSGPGANTGFHSINEDNYSAWGAITSRRLNAQYHCTAYSGRGMFRNNNGTNNGVLPELFHQTIPDDANSSWDHSNYIPDVVVIHLGTNDFANEQSWATNNSPLDSVSYVNKYIEFIDTLRVKYGSDTKIICAFGSLISIWSGFNQYQQWINYINDVVGHFNANVFKYQLVVQNAPYGEDWHPAKHEHLNMADQITPFIQQITNWKDCEGIDGGNAFLDDCAVCVGGNTGLSACSAVITNAVENINQLPKFKIYPNPTSTILNIENANFDNDWEIYNATGNVVKQFSGNQINIMDLVSGFYILKNKSEKLHQKITFIKE